MSMTQAVQRGVSPNPLALKEWQEVDSGAVQRKSQDHLNSVLAAGTRQCGPGRTQLAVLASSYTSGRTSTQAPLVPTVRVPADVSGKSLGC